MQYFAVESFDEKPRCTGMGLKPWKSPNWDSKNLVYDPRPIGAPFQSL